jgi:toxin YoeB
MKRKIEFSNTARKDIVYHRKSGNQAILNKINSLILEISETPFSGTGKPEPLKYDLSAKW